MQLPKDSMAWWGPPKRFDVQEEDRRVSWLELFYDLVYVIAIARITHHLSLHISTTAFIEYASLFVLIYWGWLNGSLYHDIHGNEGLRTRLTTLWQMMIIAALAVSIDQSAEGRYLTVTIVLMIMQFYITYLWWSIGFYDRSHRRYNMPYTILYLLSFGLMGLSLALGAWWLRWILPLVMICNYGPPFVSQALLRRSSLDLDLSPSMFERLGLFTIIVFGETVLGVVNGISQVQTTNLTSWLDFAIALSIVFSLWWIFFTLVSRREPKKSFLNATLLELLFIPALLSLGLMAACWTSFFQEHDVPAALLRYFGYALTAFLVSISLMMGLVIFPERFQSLKRPIRVSLLTSASVFFAMTWVRITTNSVYYLLVVLAVLVGEIIYLNSVYYRSRKGYESVDPGLQVKGGSDKSFLE